MKKQPIPHNQLQLPFEEPESTPPEPLTPPESLSTTRTITVRPKWEVNQDGHIYPEIRFSGKYLEDANFLIGRPVMVVIRKNTLMISIRKPDTDVNPEVADWLDKIKTRRQTAAKRRQANDQP